MRRTRRSISWLVILTFHVLRRLPVFVWLWLRRRPIDLQRELGRALASAAVRLGPTATKLAQIASSRPDLLPAPLTDALVELQDRAPVSDVSAIHRALASAYDVPFAELFEHLEAEPIAAGSVAVVLRGRTRDGADVALKVVRPGVVRQIEDDLALLGAIVALLARFDRLSHLRLREVFDTFTGQIRRQCDMHVEARCTSQLRALIGSQVIVPEPRGDLTRRDVLVTAFLNTGGLRISDPRLPRAAYETGCLTLLRALYRMIFVHGVVHLDLHPGNVHVDCEGRVTLFDYGLIAEIDAAARRSFRDFMVAVGRGDAESATHHLIEASISAPASLDRTRLRGDMQSLLDECRGQRAGRFLVFRFVRSLSEIQRRHGLSASVGFANAVWALTLYEGLVRARFPDLDFQSELRPYGAATLIERVRATQWAPRIATDRGLQA